MRRLLLGALCCALILLSPPAHAATALHRYQTGVHVKGLQWLLAGHRPSVFKIRAYRGPINGHYDLATVHAVTNMRYRLGWPKQSLNGNIAGPFFINVLKGRARRPISYRITAGNRIVALQKQRYNLAHPPTSTKVALLVKDAEYLIGHANLIGYSQTTRMQIVRLGLRLPPLGRFIYEDCSSSVTGLYWLAGLADPNGLGYNGYGYTGTEASHGTVVWRLGQPLSLLRPGDLVFYGGGFPHHHVTMYLGNGRVFSHGSSIGPLNLPVLYRGDAVGAHRYVTP